MRFDMFVGFGPRICLLKRLLNQVSDRLFCVVLVKHCKRFRLVNDFKNLFRQTILYACGVLCVLKFCLELGKLLTQGFYIIYLRLLLLWLF